MVQERDHLKSAYPKYSPSERVADGILHIVGLIAALIGAVVLVVLSFGAIAGVFTLGLITYGITLVGTFAASGLYHFTPWERWRPTLRRIDHAAIYLIIAGTYTPFVILIGTPLAIGVLALIWVLAGFGAIHKLFFWRNPKRCGVTLYLIMGWLSVVLLWSFVTLLPPASLMLMTIGGLLYSGGVIFFNMDKMRFSLAIWHGFVLTASICFYAAIAVGVYQSLP